MNKFLIVGVIAGGFLVLYGVGRVWKLKPETKYSRTLHRGDLAVLTIQGEKEVWVARDKDDCYSMQLAMTKKDSEYLKGCADTQTAFAVPAGTQVKVLSESVSRREVEVQTGPLAGRKGWVEHEFLRPREAGEFR